MFDNTDKMPICKFCPDLDPIYSVGYRCKQKPEKIIKNPKERPTWCPKPKQL